MKIRDHIVVRIICATFFVFGVSAYAAQPDADCISWFKAGKVKPGKTCVLNCAVLMTDMGTFMCPNQCEVLCKAMSESSITSKFIYYPGLTPAEKKLVDKNSKDAITVFVQKTRAEWSADRNFPEQNMNDESDAFRHFIWAGLLTKELGAEKAKDFLQAHEEDPDQPTVLSGLDRHSWQVNLSQKSVRISA